ncbi:MAG TPA: sigma-70 family RNA polymerase sigma factor [Vicinamibacteria bacterium]|nr:sigma-70 family RNA polymerase sigma factor [Vicinamibacteria bacterium]
MRHTGLDVAELCRRYGPMVVRRCRQLLRDDQDALDASQDVFVRLLQRQERLTAEYPSSLLYRMATNVCLNRLRDRRRAPAAADQDLLLRIAAADDPGALSEARSVLERLFGGHPPSTRLLAVLHYLDGFTLEQVAAQVGLSVSGVRKRLRSLRETLNLMEKP